MKQLDSIVVTQNLLNELGTLAAPSMLTAALSALTAETAATAPQAPILAGYRAEFKQGARAGDTVQIALEEATGAADGGRAFRVYFGKGDGFGRVGNWQLLLAPSISGRPLPYSIRQAATDGRTDRELWRPQPLIAEGDPLQDAPALLWLAGQSARGYLKRLDRELAAAGQVSLHDVLDNRIYGGIAVAAHFAHWPAPGQTLYCAVQHQLPLHSQPQDKKMDFHGVWVAGTLDEAALLGTFRFTIVRLNAQRAAIYPDGVAERKPLPPFP